MPLRLDHFAAVRVNWADKAQNIREIAAELNVGLDSLVFVDDNPHETALVSELLPAVRAILLPSDPVAYRDVLASCDLFDALAVSIQHNPQIAVPGTARLPILPILDRIFAQNALARSATQVRASA